MEILGIVLFLILTTTIGHAHNIRLLKNQSSDLTTTGFEASANNESFLKDDDTFFEGTLGYSKIHNSYDTSDSDIKKIGFQVLTPSFLSANLYGDQYTNTSEELKTKTTGLELGKKVFYGIESDSFKPNFGVRLRSEKIDMQQSKTFTRRKFDFSLEQTSTGISVSLFPIPWFEVSGSYYENRYNQDFETIKTRLNRSEFLKSLFSNIQNTLDGLSEHSKSVSIKILPIDWIDATVTRTYSDDLLSETQYYVDSIDVGIYYFPKFFLVVAAGQNYSSVDSTKTTFSEISLQFNF